MQLAVLQSIRPIVVHAVGAEWHSVFNSKTTSLIFFFALVRSLRENCLNVTSMLFIKEVISSFDAVNWGDGYLCWHLQALDCLLI